MEFNIYCDESCHLENDQQRPMLFGCVWVPRERARQLSLELRSIKDAFGARGELKWTKVSQNKLAFYLAVVTWFFQQEDVHFRALVVPDKKALDHQRFDQQHDDFYYKMYFWLLNKIIYPDRSYRIYLDVKDTRSRSKVRELRRFLSFDKYDFEGKVIQDLRSIRSYEAQLMQLADFLLGAVSYKQRGLKGNLAKSIVVSFLEATTKRPLDKGTPLSEEKFNVFIWQPRR